MGSSTILKTQEYFTHFWCVLQKAFLDPRGNLKQFIGYAFVAHILVFLGFSLYIYEHATQSTQKEAVQLANRVEKVFLLEMESLLEEMMRFGKEKLSNPSIEARETNQSLIFYPGAAANQNLLFHWALQLDRPLVDQKTGLWVIPASLPLLNDRHQEAGKILKLINMHKLAESIRKNSYQRGSVFALIDPRFGAVFQSENNPSDHKSLIYPRILQNMKEKKQGTCHIEGPDHDVRFLYFQSIPNFPYVIVTGVQPSYVAMLISSSIWLIIPYAVLAFLLCLSAGWIFHFHKQRILEAYQKALRGYLLNFCVETVVDTLKACRVKTEKIPSFALPQSSLGVEKTEINRLIQESLLLLELEFLQKGAKLQTFLRARLPELWLHTFDFQKILISLLKHSLEMCGKRGCIKIRTSLKGEKMLLSLEDNGFHLGIEERLEFALLKSGAFAELSFKTALDLLKDMNIEISITPKIPKGNLIILELPLSSPKTASQNVPSNVVYLKR